MKVKDVMTKDVISIDKDVDLRHVMKLMKKNDITKIPVLEDKKIFGLVTDNTIAYKLGSKRKKGVPASRLHASSVTDKGIDCISPDVEVKTVLKKVGKPGPTMLCVTKNDELVGVVTKADLLQLVESKKQVKDLTSKKLHTVTVDDRVIHARRIMIDKNIARLPVLKNGDLVGMVSDNEIAFALASIKRSFPIGRQKHRLEELLVQEIMKKPAIWTNSNNSAANAAKIMMKENVGSLALLEGDKLTGIVTRTDLLKTLTP